VPDQYMDFEKLTIEVWTDGSINAKDAISQACEILIKHLNIFKNFGEGYVEEDQEANEELEKRKSYLSKPVAELELSVRAANCLAAANIITIKDLVTKTEQEMLKYRNFGRKSLNEIKEILNGMGLSFGMVLSENGESVKFKKIDTANEVKDQLEEDLTDDDIDEELEDDDIESEES
ncbi:MAG: DNA-directed RNA polymerase subunit alpha C-terminal domain-containing protein, partial [Candidatus Poribacteria bacterium]